MLSITMLRARKYLKGDVLGKLRPPSVTRKKEHKKLKKIKCLQYGYIVVAVTMW